MEEADQLLLLQLRQAGCTLPSSIVSLAQFSSDEVVAAVATLLNTINGNDGLATRLPANMAVRHRVSAAMAKQMKELGMPGEVGYNQLLYPSVKDTRRMIQWLAHRVPRQAEETGTDTVSGDVLAARALSLRFSDWIAAPWTPPTTTDTATAPSLPLTTSYLEVPTPDTPAPYADGRLSFVWDQVKHPAHLGPSLLERNSIGVNDAAEREGAAFEEFDGGSSKEAKKAKLSADARRAFGAAGGGEIGAGSLEDMLSTIGLGGPSGRQKGTAFAHATEFGQEHDAPEVASAVVETPAEDGEEKKEDELETLNNQIRKLETATATLLRAAERQTGQIRQTSASLASEKGRTATLEKDYNVKKKTLDMLPEADKYIAQLKTICSGSASKLMSLAAEWETHRKPLINAIRSHKEAHAARKERCREMVAAMKAMKAESATMVDELRTKEDRIRQMAVTYESMPKEVNRNVYTRRILDIIKQVRKQKLEISRIIADIRVVQRDINTLNEKLTRTVTIAEETIYKSASANSKDTAYVQSFRLLTQLREYFASIIEKVTDVGKVQAEQREFESKCDSLRAKNVDRNMAKIRRDIRQVTAENDTLRKQLGMAS